MRFYWSRYSALSLVEVLVALAITTIGLVGFCNMQLQAFRVDQEASSRAQAIWILEDLANRIRSNSEGLDYYLVDSQISCNPPAAICTGYHDGVQQVLPAQYCSAAQQARFDLWELSCGVGAEVAGYVTFSSTANYLASPELLVKYQGSGVLQLTLSWQQRSASPAQEHRQTVSTVVQP